jgi:hypothetical protein
MKYEVKDIPFSGNLIELNDIDLINEWREWDRKYQKNPTFETCEEGKLIFDKIRRKYGINKLIQVSYLKDNPTKIGIIISDIPVEENAIYIPTDEGWANNNVFATSVEKSKL